MSPMARPEAGGAVCARKAEPKGERQADEPMRAEVREERKAYVASTSECARCDALDAVKKLKRGGDPKQRDAQFHDGRVVREKCDQGARSREEDDPRTSHEAGS